MSGAYTICDRTQSAETPGVTYDGVIQAYDTVSGITRMFKNPLPYLIKYVNDFEAGRL